MIRIERGASTCVMEIVLAGMVIVGAAMAQSYSGSYSLIPQCGPTQSGPLAGPAMESQAASAACGFLCSVPPFQGTGSLNVASYTRYLDRGVVASSAQIRGDQLTAAPCGSSAGGITNVTQEVNATDIIFFDQSNPGAGGFALATLNVEFRGHAAGSAACTFGQAGISFFSTNTNGNFNGITATGSGLLAGYPNDGSSVVLTGGAFGIALNTPTSLPLHLDISATGILCESPSPGILLNVAEATLSLPHAGPVFNLPAGITCSSVQLGISNNHWTPPAPASSVSFGSGCTGSNAQPLVLLPVGLPQIGNQSFALNLTGPPAGATAFVYFAFGTAASPLQVGSCFVFLDLPSALNLIAQGLSPIGPTPVSGLTATFPLPIPLAPAIFGLAISAQGVALDAGLSGGLATSNVLNLVLGS